MRGRLLLRFSVLARRDEGAYPQRSVTEEQRSQNRKATQPSGRRFFLAQTSLLTPYRPLKGMLVARASSGPKIPRRKRGRIYGTGYLAARGDGKGEGGRFGSLRLLDRRFPRRGVRSPEAGGAVRIPGRKASANRGSSK